MLRAFCYLFIGWLLIAVVGGLADVFMLTVMLPATSVVVLAHLAFSRAVPLPLALGLAVAFGYLEDLHQDAPLGTLTLAHALAYIGLARAAERFAVGGWPSRMLSAGLGVLVVDVITFAVLMALAEPLGVRRAALWNSLWDARWHVVATALVAPPVWTLFDRVFTALKIQEPEAAHQPAPLGAPR